MTDRVARIETFIVTLPRDTPYLGALRPGEAPNARGYLVREGNGTIYPTVDRSVVVRVTTADGLEGWGETYGLVAPQVIATFVEDVIADVVVGRSPFEAAAVWDRLYDLQRVRGYQGGFWLDAVAAVDIALWDLAGKLAGQPLHRLLGGPHRTRIPAYVSGLPAPTLGERAAMAAEWVGQGFNAVKFAAVMSADGIEAEAAAIRDAIGPTAALMVDLHWMFTPAEAAGLIARLEPHRLAFAEAPVKPEDVAGLAEVARLSRTPIAVGEEWRTVWDARPRLEARAAAIVQPEMGHTGVTQFLRIAQLAAAFHVPVIPHATIGTGIFLAASLHASATVRALPWHEYQHSIFDRYRPLLSGGMTCASGHYELPQGPGLGVAPTAAFWDHAARA